MWLAEELRRLVTVPNRLLNFSMPAIVIETQSHYNPRALVFFEDFTGKFPER